MANVDKTNELREYYIKTAQEKFNEALKGIMRTKFRYEGSDYEVEARVGVPERMMTTSSYAKVAVSNIVLYLDINNTSNDRVKSVMFNLSFTIDKSDKFSMSYDDFVKMSREDQIHFAIQIMAIYLMTDRHTVRKTIEAKFGGDFIEAMFAL